MKAFLNVIYRRPEKLEDPKRHSDCKNSLSPSWSCPHGFNPFTNDGFYREADEIVRYRIEYRFPVVEMECSGLAACARFRGIKWALIQFTVDTLVDTTAYRERNWGKESMAVSLPLALDTPVLVADK